MKRTTSIEQSEVSDMADDTAPETLASNPVGDRLKAEREARGMSLDDVATITRVPTRHLLHIERGEWEALPAATYSVGFARAYANAVGLSGSEIGAELRNQLGYGQSNIVTALYEPADPARVPPRSLALVAGIIALILVIGYIVWRSGAFSGDDPQADAAAVDTPIVAPVSRAPAQNGRAVAPALPAASGPVVLTAAEDVWLRVSDAGGKALFQDTLKAGQRYEIPTAADHPQLRVARPEALRVTVGQTPVPQLGAAGQPVGNVSLVAADLLARATPAPGSGTVPAAPPSAAPAR